MSNHQDAKPDKNLKDAPMPPLPFEHLIEKREKEAKEAKELDRIARKEEALTVQEASKLIDSIKSQQDKIKRKINELFELRGVTPDYLQAYMSNPSNFSPEIWEELQKHRQELLESFPLVRELAEDKSGTLVAEKPSKTDKGEKDRRSKLGARRRGWLPMR